mmetsp:Transcript_29351/g.80616  ORF Transcript_29351/g.80616 Transcript_29351/m.80616 type:complete len:228 (+) Transcript_29351:70-753(+)|eukprot:CAMPEP_0168741166 /NCGR_PEP_ID=MMETSP0724-20121128/12365_1 /TAXON_ID=265536 /ORGANISM="Amphiprora sp., Strain CCMP467" /LENGTH=227 /DNA_ID=CAMNT_0008788645 /DNA_START=65 /DNA_END=748 /DNA_ORIENTATION=-
MSWQANLSRHLKVLRFFACPESPSSRGVMTWYTKNLQKLEYLNPNMFLPMRTTKNAYPAITTELDWTVNHVLKYMIQTNKFRDANGSIANDRVEAAKDFLATDWEEMRLRRFDSPGFDPEKPYVDEDMPGWKEDPKIMKDLEVYMAMRSAADEQMAIFQGGPDNEFEKAELALTMCQRVDLWCAGEKEVERAVVHLYKLGRALNDLEGDLPPYIIDFYPGQDDFLDA